MRILVPAVTLGVVALTVALAYPSWTTEFESRQGTAMKGRTTDGEWRREQAVERAFLFSGPNHRSTPDRRIVRQSLNLGRMLAESLAIVTIASCFAFLPNMYPKQERSK